jgi:hypothetical protein
LTAVEEAKNEENQLSKQGSQVLMNEQSSRRKEIF